MQNETTQAPPARNVDEVIEMLAPIFRAATQSRLQCIQLRDGRAAASDGRVLVRVDLPGLKLTDVARAANNVATVLDFEPEDAPLVAGRDWIEQTLAPAVEEAWGRVLPVLEDSRAWWAQNAERRARRCPCCGEKIIVDGEDGSLYTVDEWINSEAPDANSAPANIAIDLGERRPAFFVRDLVRVLRATATLGGADELHVGPFQLWMRGAGLLAVVCRCHTGIPEPVCTLHPGGEDAAK